jgi:hypothetical protein
MSNLVFAYAVAAGGARRAPQTQRRARPAAQSRRARAGGSSPLATSGSNASAPHGDEEMLIAIRSCVVGANLERVCLVIGGDAYAPRGTALIRPGETSSMIEVTADIGAEKGAVYFELCAGSHNIPLLTDELFEITPGAVLVITIDDYTRAHNASMELEGAVARLEVARPFEHADAHA